MGPLVLIAGCAIANEPKTGKTSDEPLVNTAGVRASDEGLLDYGTVVFSTNPTTLLEPGDFHKYKFDGHAGGTVTITAQASTCGDPDTVIDLFGPGDFDAGNPQLVENDDGSLPCAFDAKISNFTLPRDGTYVLVVTSFRQAGTSSGTGHYQLQLTCTNNACALAGSPTFAGSRIDQRDIDAGRFTAGALFNIGGFLFEHVFTLAEGLGNALNGSAPNFHSVGGPEAQSCITCHNVGGNGGAGDVNHNIFQLSDGVNRSSGVPRNPPAVLGDGLRQRIGEEMTADLLNERAAALAQAKSTGVNVTQSLTSKGISFGSIVAHPDQTIDFTNLKGIDTDLVVRPFGWKGRESRLRRMVEGEWNAHIGMQSSPLANRQCARPPCDPDRDGVVDEITEGQLSAMAVFIGLRETPVRVPAISATAQTRVNNGEVLFNQVGCTSCHVQNLTINVPVHVEPADTTGGSGITLHLDTDTKDPKPPVNANPPGSMTIEVFSDFKRHDVGAALADSKDFNQIKANQFLTTPLWGVAASPPYLHDGRAPTLQSAILQHAGDATTVRNNFAALTADQQSQVVEFLLTLGRQENRDAQAVGVDLSGFIMQQLRPQGGVAQVTTITFPTGTTVPHGGRVIVARNATRAAFESFYSRTLDANTLFFSGANGFPVINGGEQYALLDSNSSTTTLNVGIDGFTPPTVAGTTLQRKDCALPGFQAASWATVTASPSTANPGVAPLASGVDRFCITEIADSPTDSNFEFIEVFVDTLNIH
jgi:hypothetical protein